MRHSYALNFIGGALEFLAEQWRPERFDFRYEITARGDRVLMNKGQADRDEVKVARQLLRNEVSLSLWDQALRDFAALAAEWGFLPVVTYIPAAYTANAATIDFMDPTVGPALAAMSRAQRDYLRQQCAAHQLVWIDLTEPLQAAVADFDLAYFPSNLHLTRTGHAIVAAALAPELDEVLARRQASARVSPPRPSLRSPRRAAPRSAPPLRYRSDRAAVRTAPSAHPPD